MLNWLRRLRGPAETKEVSKATEDQPAGSASCGHLVLMPRWDALEDMGKPERATGYKCDVCGEDLSKEEGLARLVQGARIF